MACDVLRISVLLWVVIDRVGAEFCSTSGVSYRYCDSDHYCCDNGYSCCSNVIVGVGAIIGIVIGCIFFLSICIGIICCIAQSQKRPGRVIQPATGGQTIAVVGLQNTQQQTSYQQSPSFQPAQAYPASPFQPGQAYPPPPPPYNSNLYAQSMQPGPAYPPVMVVGQQNTQQQTSYQQSPSFQPAQAYPAAPSQPGQAYPPPPPPYNSNLYAQSMKPGPAYPPVMGYQSEDNIMPAKQ